MRAIPGCNAGGPVAQLLRPAGIYYGVPRSSDASAGDASLIARAILGAPPAEVPPRTLLVASPQEAEAAVIRLEDARRAGKLWVGKHGGCEVAVAAHGWGAPVAAIYLEALAGCGVDTIVRIGSCGALSTRAALGDVVVASKAHAREGTSPHYPTRPSEGPYAADRALLARAQAAMDRSGMPYHCGPVISFDAMFRETPQLLDGWRRQGMLAVDMETSAVYAVAGVLEVRAVALLHVADRPIDGVKFYHPRAVASRAAGFNRVLKAALEVLSGGSFQ